MKKQQIFCYDCGVEIQESSFISCQNKELCFNCVHERLRLSFKTTPKLYKKCIACNGKRFLYCSTGCYSCSICYGIGRIRNKQ